MRIRCLFRSCLRRGSWAACTGRGRRPKACGFCRERDQSTSTVWNETVGGTGCDARQTMPVGEREGVSLADLDNKTYTGVHRSRASGSGRFSPVVRAVLTAPSPAIQSRLRLEPTVHKHTMEHIDSNVGQYMVTWNLPDTLIFHPRAFSGNHPGPCLPHYFQPGQL